MVLLWQYFYNIKIYCHSYVRVYGEYQTDCRTRVNIVKGDGHNNSSSKKNNKNLFY